jgi:GT2 family glycosyltransferase
VTTKSFSPQLKCAVVIVNYNSGHLLLAALQGLSQQLRVPDKVIVVDNASEDASAVEAQQHYPEYSFLLLESNTGFSSANNLAISELAGFDYVALLNPDAIPAPNWLNSLLDTAKQLPEYGSFSSRMLCADDPALLDGAGDVYHISGLVWRRFYRKSAMHFGAKEEDVFSPCAGAALYRLDAIKSVGLLDEDFFCYVEDVDLGFRLQLAGYPCRYVPDATVVHVGSAITGLNSPFSIYHGHRNLVWTYVKNMPGVLFYLFLPVHILLNLLSLGFFGVKGDWDSIKRAKWDALKRLPFIWRKRRDIQKERVKSCWYIFRIMNKSLVKK